MGLEWRSSKGIGFQLCNIDEQRVPSAKSDKDYKLLRNAQSGTGDDDARVHPALDGTNVSLIQISRLNEFKPASVDVV